MIKQMTKQGEAFFPKTTTSADIDEATGKTLDTILSETEEKAEREEIKVIEVPDKWNDGSIYDLGVSAEEYFATPVIIFKMRGPGAVGQFLYSRKKNSIYTGDVYNYGVWTDTYEIQINDVAFVLNVTYDEIENQGDPNAHMKVQIVA